MAAVAIMAASCAHPNPNPNPTEKPRSSATPSAAAPSGTWSSPQDNLLANPGFEGGLAGWAHGPDPVGAVAAIDDTVACTGSRSLRVAFDGSTDVNYWHVGQSVPVEANTTYRLAGYLRVTGIMAYNGVRLEVQDSRGYTYFTSHTTDMYPTQGWTLVSVDFTTPPDTTALNMMVRRVGTDGSHPVKGTAWVDDVSLVRLPPHIAPGVLTMRTGTTQQVSIVGGNAPYTWRSSDPAVASVASASDPAVAQVKALAVGSVQISAVDGTGKTAVLALTAVDKDVITIDASHVLREVPDAMFGSNIEYNWSNDGLLSDPRFISDVSDLGVTVLRYPGGTSANYYDFSAGKGYVDWVGGSGQYNSSGITTDQYIQFMKDAHIHAGMITANVYKSGYKNWPGNNWISSRVAGDWVKHTNAAGFHIEYWELGNEVFSNDELGDADSQVPGLTRDLYIAKVHEWSKAMKAVDPTIKVGIVVWGPDRGRWNEWWNSPLMTQCAADIDFVSYHDYVSAEPYLSNKGIVDSTALNVYAQIWARHPISDLRAQLDAAAPARSAHIGIQASEWGVLAFPSVPDMSDTLMTAVLDTDQLWDMVQEGADGAAIWDLYEPPFPSLEGTPGGRKYAQYNMMWMNRNRSGKWLVESQVSAPTYTSGDVDGVPSVSAYATLSADRSKLYVIVTNKSADPQTTNIDLGGFSPRAQASTWQMTSTNWSDTGIAPQVSTITNAAPAFDYTSPARSVTSFVFDAR